MAKVVTVGPAAAATAAVAGAGGAAAATSSLVSSHHIASPCVVLCRFASRHLVLLSRRVSCRFIPVKLLQNHDELIEENNSVLSPHI